MIESTRLSESCGMTTEVYSRVVGYFRPLQNWNNGKKAEFKDRETYVVSQEEDADER